MTGSWKAALGIIPFVPKILQEAQHYEFINEISAEYKLGYQYAKQQKYDIIGRPRDFVQGWTMRTIEQNLELHPIEQKIKIFRW